MKIISIYVSIACIMLLLFSCKKDVVENDGLIGKWRLIAVYDGYANGGSFTWKNVSEENSHTLIFTAAGGYEKNEDASGAFQQCSGTYQLLPDNKLEVVSSCQTVTERMTISELSNTTLIINRAGIEGVIRYQYRVG